MTLGIRPGFAHSRGMLPRVMMVGALALAACPEAAIEPPIDDIAAPTLSAIAPGGALAIAWTATPAFVASQLRVALVPRAAGDIAVVIDGPQRAGTTSAPTATGFTWGGEDRDARAVPPGFYGLTVGDTRSGETYDGGDRNIVVVTGAAITAPAPGATLAITVGTAGALGFDTTAIGTLSLTLLADPSPADGDELVIAELAIPGEIRTIGRDYAWDGTIAGAPVAPGDYTIAALLDDGTATWRVDGGTARVTAP